MSHIVIIGNGIAGITAAREIRKRSDDPITVISAESTYFFSRTAMMYVYMGHMQFQHTQPYENWFWKENEIDLVFGKVESIDTVSRNLLLENKDIVPYDKLVIASGSHTRYFGWEGQDLDGVQGFVNKQDLEMLERKSEGVKNAVIIGGGLIGIELAEMFLTRGIQPHLLVREKHFWRNVLPTMNAQQIDKHIATHHATLLTETEITTINGENGKVKSVTLKDGEDLECELVCIATGVAPNTDFLDGSGIEIDRGILVDEKLETNISNIYAIGDCAELRNPPKGRRPIEAVWYVGRMMGETVAKTITGKPTVYQPGHWYNSAKFFDVEYQTYGIVLPDESENEKHINWINPNDEKQFMTISYQPSTKKFLGINTFGIRLRQAFFDSALDNNATVEQVIQLLDKADFQPEFFKTNYKGIQQAFLAQL